MKILKYSEIVAEVRERLKGILSEVSGIDMPEHQSISRAEGQPSDTGYDLKVRVHQDVGKEQWLCVEVKSQGHPQKAQNTISQLKRDAEKHDPHNARYPIFAAPYISPAAAKICLDEGVGFLDLSGNCHLSFGGVYIHVEGKPNQYKPKREQGSLFSPKASRVLRPLLQGPLRPWKVVDLEREAGVSLGTVSAARKELLKQAWAVESEDGLRITKPEAILDAWAKQDKWERRTTVQEYSLLEHDQDAVAAGLNKLFHNQEHAFTQWYAADLIRPYAITKITTLYVSAFPKEHVLNGELLARRVDCGGSLRLVVPKDEGVFLGKRQVNGVPVVSDIQLYLDLIHAGLRGDEAAKELRDWSEFSGGWHE
ncbi:MULTISPECIES: type IV toxin-antitoxin system AbiEi family antitoxin [unclassified Lentimonas]|uniref:type IV toxin-antitoxin system AbiEi family antitoxin n=1 Tax=unclassified Lentimonas TaxID=2630993 RepID=UPI001321A3C1|nr:MULTISPECIES: type IV toxin-antitoxin system AbiEi family antitoxin [unclassified Lentimonas]CAA6692836.1 Unannotated [Lentimonas sp. CC10]CAA6695549.1 Unannotated [Lentimonas sp. CC19]CAA7069880.1 Unannotated [Lentimonas sp. CC11]